MKKYNSKVILPLVASLALASGFTSSANASALCDAWKNAPGTRSCKGEGGTLEVGAYVKNGNGLWQCRNGAKDRWGHTVTWVASPSQMRAICPDTGAVVSQVQLSRNEGLWIHG